MGQCLSLERQNIAKGCADTAFAKKYSYSSSEYTALESSASVGPPTVEDLEENSTPKSLAAASPRKREVNDNFAWSHRVRQTEDEDMRSHVVCSRL